MGFFQIIRGWFEDRTFGVARDPRWNKLRDWYFRKHPYCELCNKRTKAIHHEIPVHIDQSKELTNENLIAVCNDCHWSFCHYFSWHSFNDKIREDIKRIKNRP